MKNANSGDIDPKYNERMKNIINVINIISFDMVCYLLKCY